MKKFITLLIIVSTFSLSAKKVKFAVDMSNQTVSGLGVHLVGDFQVAAGYALDWDPSTILMNQEGSTNIYSVILNIPAFQKYEYRFVNGDQTYESEFVPDESRVGYEFNDNRWFYLDSLQNDTTNFGAIVFGANAPAGLNLVRYKVDMTNATASSNGIHLSTNYNLNSPFKNELYSFPSNPDLNVYEVIHYLASGTYSYNFVNGNTSGDVENTVPSGCSNAGVRFVVVTKDTVFPNICYNLCVNCNLTSVSNINKNTNFNVFPNPAKNSINVISKSSVINEVSVYTITGQKVLNFNEINNTSFSIQNMTLVTGVYFMKIKNDANQIQNLKLIIE